MLCHRLRLVRKGVVSAARRSIHPLPQTLLLPTLIVLDEDERETRAPTSLQIHDAHTPLSVLWTGESTSRRLGCA